MREVPAAEETAHVLTHAIGLMLSVAGLVVLVVLASLRGDAWHVVSASIYGTTLILLYGASTVYHALPPSRAKGAWRLLDHSAIYLLIAGTYTPFTLVNLRGGWGWSLFGVVWGLATVGVVFENVATQRSRMISLVLYVGLGWLVAIAVKPFLNAVDTGGVILVALGGLAYTGGIVFYRWRELPYNHALWHAAVLVGSACHFFAILFYVIPRGVG